MLCPHCEESGIGIAAKLWSGEAFAVRCKVCGGLAYLPHSGKSLVSGVTVTAILLSIGLALALESLVPFCLGLAALAFSYYRLLWRTPMVGITEVKSRENKHWGNVSVGLCAVVLLCVTAAVI